MALKADERRTYETRISAAILELDALKRYADLVLADADLIERERSPWLWYSGACKKAIAALSKGR